MVQDGGKRRWNDEIIHWNDAYFYSNFCCSVNWQPLTRPFLCRWIHPTPWPWIKWAERWVAGRLAIELGRESNLNASLSSWSTSPCLSNWITSSFTAQLGGTVKRRCQFVRFTLPPPHPIIIIRISSDPPTKFQESKFQLFKIIF